MLNRCPHCKRTFPRNMSGHAATCPERAGIQDALRKALTGDGGYIVSVETYIERRKSAPELPSRHTLVSHYGSWGKTAAHYGLLMLRRDIQARMARQAKIAARHNGTIDAEATDDIAPMTQAEIDAEIEATLGVTRPALASARYEVDHGLPVAQHDGTPYARRLPSGGTAYLLR